MNMRLGFTSTLVVGMFLCFAPPSYADKANFQKTNPQVLAAFRDVVAKPAQSTVRVLSDDKEVALGTIVAADGWILTKASELKGKIKCKLRDGRELAARVMGIHEPFDLAMLKIDASGLKTVSWIDSKIATVGDWVAATGTGDEPLAIGVISVATRSLTVKGALTPANPANSGYLGVGLESSDGKVKVGQVMSGTPAEKVGLKTGDVILTLAGKPIEDPESFVNGIQRHKPGDVVTIKVKRGEEELEVKATLAKRPLGRGDFQNQMGGDLSNRRGGFPTILQHDSVLRPRDCGGPLVDVEGRVLGINIARAGRTETYAVPSEAIAPLLSDLKSGKLAPPPEASLADKLSQARAALQQAEEAQASADRIQSAARQALKLAEGGKALADRKVAEAKAALEKMEAEAKSAAKAGDK